MIARISEIADRFLWKRFLYTLPIFSTSDTIEKQGVINLSCRICKRYMYLVLSDSAVVFLGKGRMQPFVHFPIAFSLYIAYKKYIVKYISLKPAIFRLFSVLQQVLPPLTNLVRCLIGYLYFIEELTVISRGFSGRFLKVLDTSDDFLLS